MWVNQAEIFRPIEKADAQSQVLYTLVSPNESQCGMHLDVELRLICVTILSLHHSPEQVRFVPTQLAAL